MRSTVIVCVALFAACEYNPPPPSVDAVPTPTSLTSIVVSGRKDKKTGIAVNDEERVAIDALDTWETRLSLATGQNRFELVAFDDFGRRSVAIDLFIEHDSTPPERPELEPIRTWTLYESVEACGSIAPDERLAINGEVVAAPQPDGAFCVTVPIVVGLNELQLTAVDRAGNEGPSAQEVVIRYPTLPFVVDPLPTTTTENRVGISGSRGPGVEVLVNDELLEGAGVQRPSRRSIGPLARVISA